jgi:hypothetical protein
MYNKTDIGKRNCRHGWTQEEEQQPRRRWAQREDMEEKAGFRANDDSGQKPNRYCFVSFKSISMEVNSNLQDLDRSRTWV